MYYLLVALLFLLLYYVFVKILSSVIKGCFTALLVLGLVLTIVVMVKSLKVPVYIFGKFKVDNLKIIRLE